MVTVAETAMATKTVMVIVTITMLTPTLIRAH
jgi:hypothetical protein